MRIRFGIRTLLLALTLVAAFFPFRNFYNDWFRDSFSAFHLHDALAHRVSDGDSFDDVSSLFDRSQPHTEDWVRNHLRPLLNYEPADEYYVFLMDSSIVGAFFQFRDDVVVNHDNSKFRVPFSTVKLLNDTEPHFAFRNGPIPVYAALVFCVLVAYFSAARLIRIRKTSDNNAMHAKPVLPSVWL